MLGRQVADQAKIGHVEGRAQASGVIREAARTPAREALRRPRRRTEEDEPLQRIGFGARPVMIGQA
jgi:hypothetical protein